MQEKPSEMKNLIIALVLSAGVLLLWQIFYTNPRVEADKQAKIIAAEQAAERGETAGITFDSNMESTADIESVATFKSHADAINNVRRVGVSSDHLKGSISLKGARIDDITLTNYRTELDENSDKVILLSPSGTKSSYFAEAGWLSPDKSLAVPTKDTQWNTSGSILTPTSPVILSWDNGSNIRFEQIISLDENFMFTVEQRVINNSGAEIKIAPYGLLNRNWTQEGQAFIILHEGLLGVNNGELQEFSYGDLKDDDQHKYSFENNTGWLGITDKYWLSAIIPDNSASFKSNYQHYNSAGKDHYQADFLGNIVSVKNGETSNITTRFFTGAKKLKLLDSYAKQYDIPLFDRAVDFGVMYFITRPIFEALSYFYKLLGNFGLAILLLTILIKAALFPLANKSYKSMAQMKKVMPKMTEIRERNKDDRLKMNQEIMDLYKREKINPASGCLPMLVQIPIFFALYKVLFVTIEMRHAPFYGWIKDLSLPDPTNIFTLFGLIDWNTPSFLHIGLLPLIMSITMVIQQKLNPKPADKSQAMMMSLLPWVFLFLFAGFPAGLVVYWVWNNILSIIQQWVITRNVNDSDEKKA